MRTPDRVFNDLFARLFGARVVRTRKLARIAGEMAHAEQRAREAEDRVEQAERRIDETERRAKQAEQRAEKLERLERKFMPIANSSAAAVRISSLSRLLRPRQAHGVRKVRLGGANDGGYVCLDDFAGMAVALSFGIGQDASWDTDVANKGLIVHQYDHTVAGPPTAHANFRFSRRKIGTKPDAESESIESILKSIGATQSTSVILKIDIENAEWDAFAATPADALDKFSQIVCEFHNFNCVNEDAWFARALDVLGKLNDRFAVVHVHANNYAPLVAAGNFLFPLTLEVTYASRIKYTFNDTDETFPGPLDGPNLGDAPDHDLGQFSY